MARPHIGVIGAAVADGDLEALAEEVGRLLAAAGTILVCGGLGGVMAAACRGAATAGGTTVGILPGTDPAEANPWVGIVIPTGLGEARNALVVGASTALIAVGGGYGTLSEIAFALKGGKTVAGLRTWEIPGVVACASPEEAVTLALASAGG